jgi:hypothetical protein
MGAATGEEVMSETKGPVAHYILTVELLPLPHVERSSRAEEDKEGARTVGKEEARKSGVPRRRGRPGGGRGQLADEGGAEGRGQGTN